MTNDKIVIEKNNNKEAKMSKIKTPTIDRLVARLEKNLDIKRDFISATRLEKIWGDAQTLASNSGPRPEATDVIIRLLKTLDSKRLPSHTTGRGAGAAFAYILILSYSPMSIELEDRIATILPSIFENCLNGEDGAEALQCLVEFEERLINKDGNLSKAAVALLERFSQKTTATNPHPIGHTP